MGKFTRYLLFSILIPSSIAMADTGILKIKVLDINGDPVIGAQVQAQSPDSLGIKKSITDGLGETKLIGLDPARNYNVIISNDGYQTVKNNNVLVVSGKSFSLNYTLKIKNPDLEEIVITAMNVQMVDSTSAIVGQDITLDLTESLPTGRSFQAYLQLAPGTKPTNGDNPSSKSGVNYSDAVDSNGNTNGASTDNMYYIDGVNITDNNTGTYGANFNSEIIQEQRILTGGIPAEYEGGSGLISKVITKSGSNEWHGSINYYFQNDSLVANNKHLDGNSFSTFDTAFTLGGPLIEDKLWFFTSYQIKEKESDLVNPSNGEFMRTVNTDRTLGFAKMTWQATENDRLVASFFNDPFERSGSVVSTTLNNRDLKRDQGGDNYKFEYTHDWDNVILTIFSASHEGELSNTAINDETRNDVAYINYKASNAELNRGGSGSNLQEFRNKEEYGFTLQYLLDTDFGSHDIKFGYSLTENEFKKDFSYTGDRSQYTSIGGSSTLGEYTKGNNWLGKRDIVNTDYNRIIKAMGKDSSFYNNLLDSNKDGTISKEELAALELKYTKGNPNDLINVYRIKLDNQKPLTNKTKGASFFIQDSITYNQWTVSAGIRMEEWEHFNSAGKSIFKFDADIAPRFSIVYDINGDGNSKVWAFAGRYYDPIRTDMTLFAGDVTGTTRNEQIYTGDRWLTFRTRGAGDAIFSPNTKTPYTDEFMIGYSTSLTQDINLEITYTERTTEDLLEDYDLSIYTDLKESGGYSLPLSYFGFDKAPNTNYVLATLEGGKREYKGLEFVARKRRYDDNYQFLASYTYNDAQGNSNSDGNADLQGDVLYLDPRAPGMWGDQPGNIEHLFKMAGSYFFDNGLEFGLVYAWNSGTLYSKTYETYGRHAPLRVDKPFESRGIKAQWIDGKNVGSHTSNSYGTLDARVKYVMKLGGYQGEFFIDIFNLLDEQSATREQDLAAGDGVYKFGQANKWVSPRRFYLGTRWSF